MSFSDNTIKEEGFGEFLKNLCKNELMYQNVFKKPGPALEIRANVGTAFASRSPKVTLSSLPEQINVYHTGKALYFGIFVKFLPSKRKKKQQSYIHLRLYWAPTKI